MVCCPNIFQTKWHNLIAIQKPLSNKRSLLHVRLMHLDLVITGEGVHEVEKLVFGGCIYYQVYFRQRKTIFRASLVKVGEVDIYSPLSNFLWGDDKSQSG